MNIIRAACHHCHQEISLEPGEVTVRTRLDLPEWSYTYQCPSCAQVISRPTTQRIACLVVDAGGRVERWSADPITEAEIDRFVKLIDQL